MKPTSPSRPSFYPPQLLPWLVDAFGFLLPLIFKFMLNGLKVRISREDRKRLRKLSQERLLLLPNHPTPQDPYVMFYLASKIARHFNYVAAREVFDWDNGMRGKLFQSLGVYSLIRGAPDRESFKMTRRVLSAGTHPLVIFIEGEISHQNDSIIPFEPGVVQLAFSALEDVPADASLNLLPVAIRYRCKLSAEDLHQSLSNLELALHIQSTSSAVDAYNRLLCIGQEVLRWQEFRLELTPAQEATMNERIDDCKQAILNRLETSMSISPRPDQTILERIRNIRNNLDRRNYFYAGESLTLSPYQCKLLAERRSQTLQHYAELDRLTNLLTLRDGYIAAKPSPERYLDVIHRLETEVFGHTVTRVARTAEVRLGEPVNLRNFQAEYNANRRQTTSAIAASLEGQMTRLLSSSY